MLMKSQKYLRPFLLCLFPMCFLLALPSIINWRGPYYLGGNSDPDYAYLMNSMAVRHGFPPGHWDHPGTTIQGLGGITLLLGHLGNSADQILAQVVHNPEKIMLELVWTLSVICAAIIFASGWLMTIATGNVSLGIFFQLVPFLVRSTWVQVGRLTPEILTLSLTMLLASLTFHKVYSRRGCWYNSPYFLGVITGLVLTTKITGLPLIILPLYFIRNNLRALIKFSVGATLCGLLVILPVINTAIKTFVYYFGHWIFTIGTHQGSYGEGSGIKALSLETVIRSLESLAISAPFLTGTLLFGIIWLIVFRYSRSVFLKIPENRQLLIATVLAGVGQFLMVSKQPNIRYLIPGFVAQGLILVLALRTFKNTFIRGGLTLTAFFLAIWIPFVSLGGAENEKLQRDQDLALIDSTLKFAGCFEIPTYRSTSVPFALSFGNNFTGLRFSKALAEAYPDYLSYNPSEGLLDFDRRVLNPEKIKSSGRKFCIRGWKSTVPPKSVSNFMTYQEILTTQSDDSLFLVEWKSN